MPVAGTLLAACRAGSTKDSEDETVLLAVSEDDGRSFGEAYRPFPPTVDCYGTDCAPPPSLCLAWKCRHVCTCTTQTRSMASSWHSSHSLTPSGSVLQCPAGTHRMAYFTEVGSSGHVIACVHATDRLTSRGEPLFNEETVCPNA